MWHNFNISIRVKCILDVYISCNATEKDFEFGKIYAKKNICKNVVSSLLIVFMAHIAKSNPKNLKDYI